MALADELLDNISEEQFAEYMLVEENPHIVIDKDRNIILPERYKVIAAQGDHNMATYTFDCPRFSDGRDMSKMVVYINYIRSDGETGSYPADNVSIDAQDNNLMHFEWTPLLPATLEHGAFAFLVCVCRTEPDGNMKNHWSTRLCKDATISEGMDCHQNTIIDMCPDVITRILERLNVLEDGGTTSVQYTVQDLEEEQKVQARKNIEAADAKEVSKLSEEIVGLKYDKFKVNPILTVGFLMNDGSINLVESGYRTTDLIKIPKGFELVFNSRASNSTYNYCHYNADGSFNSLPAMSGIDDAVNNTFVISAYESDVYVKLCTNTNLAPSDFNAYLKKIEPVKMNATNIVGFMPTSGLVFGNGFISVSSNSIVQGDGYKYSGAIYLAKGQTISFKASGSNAVWLLSEWDRNSTSLKQGLVMGDNLYHRVEYTATKDMFVKVCSRISGTDIEIPENEFKTSIFVYHKDYIHANEKLKNKKIVVIGDSLIYGNLLGSESTWCEILKQNTGANVYNYGINGNAISNISGASGSPMSVRYADISEISNADFVIVEGGTNDKNQNCPLGSIGDTTNETFKGACNVLIDGIRAINPKTHLLFMTPYHRYATKNTLNLTEFDYAVAMEEVCERKAVPCFNNCKDSGIHFTDVNMKSWCDEGVSISGNANSHFSAEAYEWIYPKYKNWIEKQI